MQVEYYFSDHNLKSDTYLLALISDDPHDYVHVALINRFPLMRRFGLEPAQLAQALRASRHLELSDDGSRVRRRPSAAEAAASPGPV